MAHNTIGDMIGHLVELEAKLADAKAIVSALDREIGDLKSGLKQALIESGQDKAAAHGVTVSVVEKYRATYDPANWPQIVKWAVETGNDHIIQRRLTDAKVVELIRSGEALPWGLDAESYRDLLVRRS